jgi:hypothetical protein
MADVTRFEVLAIFEKHRKKPGAPFEDENFLDYLLEAPKQKRAVYDSFSGLRRFNAFIDEAQLHFSIYFSLEDRDANYSLPKFIERVEFLQGSRRSSITSFRNQQKRGFGWNTVVLFNFLLVSGLVVARSNTVVLTVLVAVMVAINVGALALFLRDRAYNKQLLAQLTESSAK